MKCNLMITILKLNSKTTYPTEGGMLEGRPLRAKPFGNGSLSLASRFVSSSRTTHQWRCVFRPTESSLHRAALGCLDWLPHLCTSPPAQQCVNKKLNKILVQYQKVRFGKKLTRITISTISNNVLSNILIIPKCT